MTVIKSIEIYKKLIIKQVAIYGSSFNGGRMRKICYHSTLIDFLKVSSNCVEENNLDVYVEVNVFGDMSVFFQLWMSVKNIINGCNDRIIVFMKKFGINKDADLSPLC